MTYNEGLEAAARWHDCQAAALKSGRSHSLRKIKRFHEIAAQEIRSKVMAPVSQPDDTRVFVVTALAEGADKIGWRSVLVSAANEDEAVGIGLRHFQAKEPSVRFNIPGALEVTATRQSGGDRHGE